MELLSERLNHLEWRSFLLFESRWSGKSLPASFKAWKFGATRVPSRDGEDRRGYAGSPMDSIDEQRADEDLPDEEIWRKMASMPSWIYETDLEEAQHHRAYFKARSKRLEALQSESEELGKLSCEQRRSLKSEHFWMEQHKKAISLSSIVEDDEPEEPATTTAAADAEQAEPAASGEQPQPAQQPRWVKVDL